MQLRSEHQALSTSSSSSRHSRNESDRNFVEIMELNNFPVNSIRLRRNFINYNQRLESFSIGALGATITRHVLAEFFKKVPRHFRHEFITVGLRRIGIAHSPDIFASFVRFGFFFLSFFLSERKLNVYGLFKMYRKVEQRVPERLKVDLLVSLGM